MTQKQSTVKKNSPGQRNSASQKLQNVDFAGQVAAIGKAQAVIEFELDGTIITANDNFLRAMGYTLEEVKGKHHNMFVDEAFKQSAEYKEFWAKLNRGEYQAAEYKRLGKGGKEVWIQASYNPILDLNDKPFKVVKYATDVTEQKLKNADYAGQIAAIGKAQAVIEFHMDGTVITANDNFLKVMGYTLAEIKGQHHSMFVDEAFKRSVEYKEFWATLNRGEYQAAEYKRLGKGGKEVWIQASYNPILDLNDKPFKVVKYATDVTEQAQAREEIKLLVKAGIEGRLDERANSQRFSGAFRELLDSINNMLDAVVAPVKEGSGVLEALAKGDLTKRVAGAYQGGHELMKTSINNSVENLARLVEQIRFGSDAITQGSSEISAGNQDLSQRMEEQASSLEETAASMEEMTSTVKQSADNAKQANQLALQCSEVAGKGGQVVSKAVSSMEEINKSSKKIADIIGVIDEIAFQTNLLALNAAVEAARAGEQGRGFAVVAAEVRNLAQRSAGAAKEIKSLIQDSVQRVDEGSKLVNQSGTALEEIVGSVKRVSDIIAEISAAAQEQSAGIEQVNKAVMQLDQITQQNAALVEETAAASGSMNEQAQELKTLVGQLKLDQETERRLNEKVVALAREKRSQKATVGRRPEPVKRSSTTPALMRRASLTPTATNGSTEEMEGFEEF